jgi:hypothetical protein
MCGLHEVLNTWYYNDKQVTWSQKGSRKLNILNQNQTFFLLPFETIIIMTS